MTDASGMESSRNSSQDSSKISGMSCRPQLQHRHFYFHTQKGRNSPYVPLSCLKGADKIGNYRCLILNCVFLFSCFMAMGSDKADGFNSHGDSGFPPSIPLSQAGQKHRSLRLQPF